MCAVALRVRICSPLCFVCVLIVTLPTRTSLVLAAGQRTLRLEHDRLLGRLMGKALKDGRMLDIPLALPLCALIVGLRRRRHSSGGERDVDVGMGESLV